MYGEFPVIKILEELAADNLLPAILFRTSRKQCDGDIEILGERRSAGLSEEQRRALMTEIRQVIEKYKMPPEVLFEHPHYQTLLSAGVGAHHAGQLLLWRLLLEELMTRGVLRLMIATGTVAAGVDFPARTVVITAHSKRGSEGFNILTSSEFQQMSGRAGRRGKDAIGICLIAPSPFSDARVIHEVAKRPPEPLRSAYFAAPSTVLNLLKFRSAEDLRFTVSKSLAAFLDRKAASSVRGDAAQMEQELQRNTALKGEARKKLAKRVRRRVREAEQLEERQGRLLEESLAGLTELGHMENGALSPKGYWAAELCTSLVLELAEAIESGLFDELPLLEFVGLVASIAGDPHRSYLSIRKNPMNKEYLDALQGIVERVRGVYQSQANAEVVVQPDAALTVITWMEAEGWRDFVGLLRLGGVAEGDAARLITQTADHLNQISRLVATHPVLAAAAAEGRARILRPPLLETLALEETRQAI